MTPVLYSFRRCPFAMRARMALAVAGETVELREVVLRDKPDEMIKVSPKATVPVLQLAEGTVLEESLDIMLWALERSDPEGWLAHHKAEQLALVAACQADFKLPLDHYKYPNRYEGIDPMAARTAALDWVHLLGKQIDRRAYLFGDQLMLADIAIFPFIRQFANVDRAWFDMAAPDAVVAWLNRCLDLPIFRNVMQKYPAWKPEDPPTLFPAF